jgi:hypothetical protein
MTAAPRRALRALAERHGLSDRSLTLIKEATVQLTDAQIRSVIDAVETCVLSGLTEHNIEQVIAEHRARAPQDWRESFWRERLALANDSYTQQRADEALQAEAEPLPLAAEHPTVSAIEPEPPQPRPAQAVPVAAIPPQPPSELGSGAPEPATPPARERQTTKPAAKQAA